MDADAKEDAKQYLKLDTVNGHNNVIIETVKQAEDGEGTIIRVFECKNMRTKATITLPAEAKEVYLCDMLETVEEEILYEK